MKTFLNYYPRNQTEKFTPSDTEQIFNKNRKKQPKNWIYRNKEIEYKTNKHGFRCISLDEINWSESIVVFGCSTVFGIGLAEEDCLTSLIEKNLGKKTVNLGIPGSAVDLACINSYFLQKNLPHPKAVIQIWTSQYRYTEFYSKDTIVTRIPQMPRYRMRESWECRNRIYMEIDKHLWGYSNSAYLEATFFSYEQFPSHIEELPIVDKARDLMHPGIDSHKLAADILSQKLEEKL